MILPLKRNTVMDHFPIFGPTNQIAYIDKVYLSNILAVLFMHHSNFPWLLF
jgi:hypothetical protein